MNRQTIHGYLQNARRAGNPAGAAAVARAVALPTVSGGAVAAFGCVRTVTIPYPPQVNHLYTVARGRKVKSAKGRAYCQRAAAVALAAGMRPVVEGGVRLRIDVYRPRRVGDLDNTLKAILDSIKGVGYADDRQVIEIHARRFDDAENPRAVVTVEVA